jgi:eukaryotic-like serine/threonine-protein kinase
MSAGEPSPDSKPAPRLGSYLLVQPLGSGGMSSVFRAVHEETGSVVAVKVLPRALAKNVTLLQRFIREAKSAEALDHPNIVAIYDRGFDQGRHYLVLEFVEGRDLHDRVRINGAMAPDDAVRFIREVAEGLRYASEQGMIHRDVKPANLLLTPDGHAKIIDLGLALQVDDEDERVTRDGTTVGTVDYMAPEQARDSRQTSERSDIYSLGCTFYYLMTGSAPFPGGGLSDKLARHYKAPIPDVRTHRADVSEELSLLIRKMMEKKPDLRFADYTQLIASLDNLGKPASSRIEAPILDAMIVDDEDEIGLAPTDPVIARGKNEADRLSSTHDQYLMAEIVDDDEDEPVPKRPPSSPSKSRPREASPKNPGPPPPDEVSLAELAALDADDESGNRRSGQRKAPSSSQTVKTSKTPSTPRLPAPSLHDMVEEDEEAETLAGSSGPPRRNMGDEVPLKTWIAAGVLIGLSLAIVAFGVSMIISMTKTPKPLDVVERPVDEPSPKPSVEITAPPPRINRPTRPTPPIATTTTPAATPSITTPPAEVVATIAPPPAEKTYSPEWETRFFPGSLTQSSPLADRSKVVVRRVIEPGDEIQTSSLASALTRAVDVVEISDTGPFFEDDCQISGKTKWIRARPGIRPMIRIEITSNEVVKEQTAKVVVGGTKVEHLVLEGIDLAVDVRALPDHQTALFLCQGVDLTLRDCSLTVVNANDSSRVRRFTIFRVEDGPRPNRIILERSTIRGPVRTLFEVAAARASIVFDRSIVIGDTGPLIVLENTEKPGRSFAFHRSLIATRGPVLEFPAKAPPPVVRSLGSTFARIDGTTSSPMIVSKANIIGEPSTVLDWSGEANAFVGWSGWLASNLEPIPRVADVAKIRATWPGSDGSSYDSPTPWPVETLRDDLAPRDLASLAPDRLGTLFKIAPPHPKLKDLTLGSLLRLVVPELSASLLPPLNTIPGQPSSATTPPSTPLPTPAQPKPVRPAPEPNATGPRPKVAPAKPQDAGPKPPPKPPEPLNLTFNVTEGPWFGDLGAYLAEKIVEGTFRVTVQVRGGGVHPMSPLRLPNGLSIGILGDSIEGSKLPMPTFIPKPGMAGRTMIELHGGDLALANLGFASDGANRPLHWIYAEDCLLALRHCRLREPGISSPTVGPLIAFVARSTTPIPERVGPLASATDRPTARLKDCLIWTGGEAILAELGRGVVALENCLIISGGPAVSLMPQKVARDGFEADLVMDRCTIAVDRTSIHLGAWPGDSGGPSRPWLVSTKRCVFPRTQTGPPGALLQVDPNAMARGTLFWQSFGDVYDITRFLAPTGTQPSSIPAGDLKKQWIDLWGLQHTRNDQGPNPRRADQLLRFKDKLKPGRVIPGSLELDGNSQKDLGVDFKELPPAPRA